MVHFVPIPPDAPARQSVDEFLATFDRYEYVEGTKVLTTPVFPVPVPRDATQHPVLVARAATDAPALDAVQVYAAYHAHHWTPAMYEYAVERAGMMLERGYTVREADARAMCAARLAFWMTPRCDTCAHWRQHGSAVFGACVITHRATRTHHTCAEHTYRQRVDQVLPDLPDGSLPVSSDTAAPSTLPSPASVT
jgi:hypothetical protein